MNKRPDDLILVITCPFCRIDHEVAVNPVDYWNWQHGWKVQDVFPYLSATEREQLISHVCPRCQDQIFGKGA